MKAEFCQWLLDYGTQFFCGITAAIFLLSFVKLINKRIRINSALEKAINSVKSYSGDYGGGYLSLDHDISQSETLRFAWDDFSRQVTDGKEYGLTLGLYSKLDSREFFHEESIWWNQSFHTNNSGLIRKFFGFFEAIQPSVPSLLTGIGILGYQACALTN